MQNMIRWMNRAVLLMSVLPVLLYCQTPRLQVPLIRFQLPNGLDVILHVNHATPTVSVNCWYHVGSSREEPGRTGLAHLFEHLMFMGSPHAPEGKFDQWLEAAGGDNNASTSQDRTNYYEDVPSNALELPLFLESDRMGYLTNVMTPEKVDLQRAVVKNERRESYENVPYGMAGILLNENVFPPSHPYHWPVIGSQGDLTAATYQDIVSFFKRYYIPNNASLVIAGDIDPVKARLAVEKWFDEVPAGRTVPPMHVSMPQLDAEKHLTYEDDVQLPRLYLAWITPPFYAPGDADLDILASVLTDGKNARLYRALVYDQQIAQDVVAYQESHKLASKFVIIATARAGHSLREVFNTIQRGLDSLKADPPLQHEVQRAVNQYETSFYRRLERMGGSGGMADQINSYLFFTGTPDYFNQDLQRYLDLRAGDIQQAARVYLRDNGRVVLSVVPRGRRDLAVP
jgi:zinc protease